MRGYNPTELNKILIVFLALLMNACATDEKKSGYQIDYYPDGSTHRYFALNEKGIKEGIYFCYYDNGRLKTLGEIASDSVLINEEFSFNRNGKLLEYSFYNIIGEKRFHRVYDSIGRTVIEEGDFFAYTDLNGVELKEGDSLSVVCYLANPPNVLTNVYLLKDNKRTYTFKKGEKKFTHCLTKRMKKSGSYVMFVEAELKDLRTSCVETRRDSLKILVK